MENDTLITILYIILLWFLLLTIRIQILENRINRSKRMEDDNKLREFNEQMEKQHFYTQPIQTNQAQPQQYNSSPPPPDQNMISSFNPGTPPSEINASFARCEQCGTMHPPVEKGKRCPVAPIKDEKGQEIDLNSFFAQLKNICMSQIQQKGIKDTKKLFQFVTVELTKILENYNE